MDFGFVKDLLSGFRVWMHDSIKFISCVIVGPSRPENPWDCWPCRSHTVRRQLSFLVHLKSTHPIPCFGGQSRLPHFSVVVSLEWPHQAKSNPPFVSLLVCGRALPTNNRDVRW